MMIYLDPATADRINRTVDNLHARISRAEEIHAAARERLDQARHERELERRERRTAIQADAASLYERWGFDPPTPVSDESSAHYKRRVLKDMQRHLAPGHPFSSLRLSQLPEDREALKVLAPRIEAAFADSYRDPMTVPPGTLREIQSQDHAGHRVSTFVGRQSFIHDMVAPVFKVVGGSGGVRRQAELNSRLR
jgi:hypothetical protein